VQRPRLPDEPEKPSIPALLETIPGRCRLPAKSISKEDLPPYVFRLKLPLRRMPEETPTRILASLEQMKELMTPELLLDHTGIQLDEELEEQSTIPMMELCSITTQRQQDIPVMQAEISGAASNASISGLANVVGYMLKTGSTFLMQHTLGAIDFGIYSLSISVVSLIASIFALGLDDAMVRYTAIYHSRQQAMLVRNLTIFCTALAGGLGLLGAIGMMAFAPQLAQLIAPSKLKTGSYLAPYLVLMAAIIPLSVMQMIWMGGLQGFKDFKRRVLVQRVVVPSATVLMLGISLLFFKQNIVAVMVITLISTLISTVFHLYFLFSRLSEMKGTLQQATQNTYEAREWLGFSTPNFLSNIVDMILDAIDTMLLGHFEIGAASIGRYNAATKISGFIAMPLTSLNAIFSPSIAELHSRGEKEKLEAMFKVVTQWAITFSLPIFCISALFSTTLLEVLSGRDFIAAWPLLVIFGLSGMANAVTGSVGFMLLMTGHQKVSFINSLVAIIVNVVLGLILTPLFGVMGTAISTGLATVIVNLMRLLQVRLLLKIHPYRKAMIKPLLAGLISSGVTGALIYILDMAKVSIIIAYIHIPVEFSLIPVFLAGYVGILMLFGATPEDRIVLDKLQKKLKHFKRK